MDTTTLVQLLLPIAVLQVILLITALVSLVKQEQTNGPRWLWVILIIFVNIIGPVLYFIIGRKER
ncbi:PLD nuclease N-terminal domain-containing protein [Bacillus sp. JJ722]|uniref:PLD nuclease N-terminal domain-containing protein n=1 Tax=Bacillus sp. JJ722 TaxID=3122973 RepID=UPI0030000EEE